MATAVNGRLKKLSLSLRTWAAATLSDRELLQHFVLSRQEMAFETIVQRHGSMVLGICKRMLRHEQDAEDAFQATFIVLARKASNIRKQESLAGWLHGVAFRTANKLRSTRTRRRHREHALPDEVPGKTVDDLTWREVQTVLDEEINRLADKYRGPLLLCYVQAKTRDEAAAQLGIEVNVLRGRLDRGRDLLRSRLTRRGLSLSAPLLASGIGTAVQAGCATQQLVHVAVQTASGAAIASPTVVALTQGVIQAMFVTKLKSAVFGVAMVAFLGTGVGLMGYGARAGEGGTSAAAQVKKAGGEDDPLKLKQEIERLRIELATTRLELLTVTEKFAILTKEMDHARLQASAQNRAVQAEKAVSDYQFVVNEYLRLKAKPTTEARKPEPTYLNRPLASDALLESVARSYLLTQQKQKDPALSADVSASLLAQAFLDYLGVQNAVDSRAYVTTPRPTAVAVSPDGRIVIVAQARTFHVFDVKTGRLLATCTGHEQPVNSVAFSPDGKVLASAASDNKVVLWDVATGKQIRQIRNPAEIGSILFSPDQGRLIIRRADGVQLEFDVNTGKAVKTEKAK